MLTTGQPTTVTCTSGLPGFLTCRHPNIVALTGVSISQGQGFLLLVRSDASCRDLLQLWESYQAAAGLP